MACATPGRHDHPGIVRAAVIVAINEETHRARRHSRTHIAQNHFRDALDEKHHVPLLVARNDAGNNFPAPRQSSAGTNPPVGPIRNARRMNVKAFGGLRKHARVGPLRRPEPDPREHAFIAADKFAERTSMPLRINRSRENLHAGNPGLSISALVRSAGRQLARFDARPGQLLGKCLRARNRA